MTQNAEPLLRMRGIGKTFGPTRVLDEVDFDLLPGEVHVLAGENGAGKSTLMKILAGVYLDYEGEIMVRGSKVRFQSPQHANATGISVIHQELSLIPGMRVMDNIFLGRERCALPGWMAYGRERESCAELLLRLGLDVDPLQPAEAYPLSVQQRIEIAKALAFDAGIIVMDEPTSALSAPEVAKLVETIADLKSRGCGVIYITHKMEEIYAIADRITVLRDGAHVGTARASDLSRPELLRRMVGRDVNEQFPRRAAAGGAVRLRLEDFTVPDPAGRPRPAVGGVTLEVRAGEVLGLGGLQGSGASELLSGLFGAYGARTGGRVELDGNPFVPRSPARAIRHGIGLLTNDRKGTGLVLNMDIVRNVTLASVPRYSPGWWLREARELKAAEGHRRAFGIRASSLRQSVETLSGGNQQKVALAKWVETRPRLLLLDEPTRGVDVGAKQEIYALINEWTAQGIAIMLITSEMPELIALSDRIVVMHRGRVTAEMEGRHATQEAVLAAAMGVEDAHA